MDEDLGPIADVTDPGSGDGLQSESPSLAGGVSQNGPIPGGVSSSQSPGGTSGGGGYYAPPNPIATPASPVVPQANNPVVQPAPNMPLLTGTNVQAPQAVAAGVAPNAVAAPTVTTTPMPGASLTASPGTPIVPLGAQVAQAQTPDSNWQAGSNQQDTPLLQGYLENAPESARSRSLTEGWEPQVLAMLAAQKAEQPLPSFNSPVNTTEGGTLQSSVSPGKPLYEGPVSENVPTAPMPTPEEQKAMQVSAPGSDLQAKMNAAAAGLRPPDNNTPDLVGGQSPLIGAQGLDRASMLDHEPMFLMMPPVNMPRSFEDLKNAKIGAGNQAVNMFAQPLQDLYRDKANLVRDLQAGYDRTQGAIQAVCDSLRDQYKKQNDLEWNTPIPGLRVPVYDPKNGERVYEENPTTGRLEPVSKFGTRSEYRANLLSDIDRLEKHEDTADKIDRQLQQNGAVARGMRSFYTKLGHAVQQSVPQHWVGFGVRGSSQEGANAETAMLQAYAERFYNPPAFGGKVTPQNNPQLVAQAAGQVAASEAAELAQKKDDRDKIDKEWEDSQTGKRAETTELLNTAKNMSDNYFKTVGESYKAAASYNEAINNILLHQISIGLAGARTANSEKQLQLAANAETRQANAEANRAQAEADKIRIEAGKLEEEHNWHEAIRKEEQPLEVFNMAAQWLSVQKKYHLTDDQMLSEYNSAADKFGVPGAKSAAEIRGVVANGAPPSIPKAVTDHEPKFKEHMELQMKYLDKLVNERTQKLAAVGVTQ